MSLNNTNVYKSGRKNAVVIDFGVGNKKIRELNEDAKICLKV